MHTLQNKHFALKFCSDQWGRRSDSGSAVLKIRSTQKPQYSKIRTLRFFRRDLQPLERLYMHFEGWFRKFRQFSFSITKNNFHKSHILGVMQFSKMIIPRNRRRRCGSVSYKQQKSFVANLKNDLENIGIIFIFYFYIIFLANLFLKFFVLWKFPVEWNFWDNRHTFVECTTTNKKVVQAFWSMI